MSTSISTISTTPSTTTQEKKCWRKRLPAGTIRYKLKNYCSMRRSTATTQKERSRHTTTSIRKSKRHFRISDRKRRSSMA